MAFKLAKEKKCKPSQKRRGKDGRVPKNTDFHVKYIQNARKHRLCLCTKRTKIDEKDENR